MPKPKTYLTVALSSFAVLFAVFAANALFLFRAGELTTVPDMVADQQSRHAIVNQLYHSLTYYKYQSYRARGPEVVAIGTSRAMQFRAYHFTRPFYNLGGVDGEPEQYQRSFEVLLRDSPPRLALVTIDFWQYCYREGATPRTAYAPAQPPSRNPGSVIRLPADLLARGKLDAGDYLTVLRRGSPKINGLRFIGIPASLERHGFAADGSRYSFMVPGHERGSPLSARWAETLERIAEGKSNFQRDCSLNREKVDRLLFGFAQRLRSAGTEVVLIFPPMPAVTTKAMAEYGGAYDYIDELRRYLAERAPVTVLDFHDSAALGSPDCEFRDGFHGGEVSYMRMLLAGAEQVGAPLAKYLDLPFLRQVVATHRGRLTIGTPFLQQAMAGYFAREAGAEGCRDD